MHSTLVREYRYTPFLTLVWREIQRFRKVIVQTVAAPIVSSTLYLLIFGVSLVQSIELSSSFSYLAFLIPGLVMMGCLNNAFQNSSSSIASSKFSGDLEDYKVSPLGEQQIVWAVAVGGLVRGLVVAAITFAVGQIFHFVMYEKWLSVAHPLVLLFFVITGGLAFSMLGLSVAFWARTVDQLSAVGSFVLLPLIYLGGVFFSLENLHPFWKALSKVNPLLYLINGVRYGILGQSDVSLLGAAAMALATLLLLNLIALRSLRHGSFTRW